MLHTATGVYTTSSARQVAGMEEERRSVWKDDLCARCLERKKCACFPSADIGNYCFAFSPDNQCGLHVPKDCVLYQPRASLGLTRRAVCKYYRHGSAAGCTKGCKCNFLHLSVDWRHLMSWPLHINYVYRSLSECPYERLSTTESFVVTVHVSDTSMPLYVKSTRFLRTQAEVEPYSVVVPPGSAILSPTLQLCHQFHVHGLCNEGPRCKYVHMLIPPFNADQHSFKWMDSIEKLKDEDFIRGENAWCDNIPSPECKSYSDAPQAPCESGTPHCTVGDALGGDACAACTSSGV